MTDGGPPIEGQGPGAGNESPLPDPAGERSTLQVPDEGALARRKRNQRLGNLLLINGTRVGVVIPLLALVGMLVILLIEAIPAIRYNGFGFFTSSVWTPGSPYLQPTHAGGVYHLPGAHFGAWPLIAGTLETSAIAIFVGFPVAVGTAVILVEKLPPRLATVCGVLLEVLAGIPSAVIGIFGIFTFGPWMAQHVYSLLVHFPNVPILNIFRGVPAHDGEGLLTGGLVLGTMIIPIVAATTRDLLLQVPDATKEAAEALGMTSSETFFTVQARWVRTGVIGAAVLGLGRALGETIAIALVAGGVQQLATDIYSPVSTIAATIVLQLSTAESDPTGLYVKTFAEAALVLLAITLVVNVVARFIVKRAARGAALPVGAGF